MSDVSLQTLFTPIKLNVMYSSQAVSIAKERLDMSGAQYYDASSAEVKPDDTTPGGISDRFLTKDYAQPSSQVHLPPGLYLHWSLTDALATMRQSPLTNNQLNFPTVPNRWMITRTSLSDSSTERWLVESDYLFDPAEVKSKIQNDQALSVLSQFPVTMNFTPDEWNALLQRPDHDIYQYRYIGLQIPWEKWKGQPNQQAEYLSDYITGGLTVVGYGEPTFASVFSNCRTVFGFHDHTADASSSYRYDVMGWYSNPQEDCLQNFWLETSLTTDADRFTALLNEYHWAVSQDTTDQTFPSRVLLYASLQVTPQDIDESSSSSGSNTIPVNLAVGNNGTEALATYLAATITDNNAAKRIAEEQLEALPLINQVQSSQIDLEQRLAQLEHQWGFKALHGGRLWSIQAPAAQTSATRASEVPPTPQIVPDLPTAMTSALNRLNQSQSAYDHAQNAISDLQHRLFADWYKYDSAYYADPNRSIWDCIQYQSQLANYRAGGEVNLNSRLPNPNTTKTYLTLQLQETLLVLAETGELLLDSSGLPTGVQTFTLPDTIQQTFSNEPDFLAQLADLAADSLAETLWAQYQDLQSQITTFNQTAQTPVNLVPEVAPRYWQPTEPALVMVPAGQTSLPPLTGLYGHDGELSCSLLSLQVDDATAPFDKAELETLYAEISQLIPTPTTCSSITTGSVMMEWFVSIRPILSLDADSLPGTRPNPSGAGVDFLPDYLRENFTFAEDALDLQANPNFVTSPSPSAFSGNVILTNYANIQLMTGLQKYLTSVTLLDLKDSYLRRDPDASLSNSALAAWYATGHPQVVIPTYDNSDDDSWNAWFADQYPFEDANGNYPVNSDVLGWYETCPVYQSSAGVADVVTVYLQALNAASQLSGIGQSLGGFNAALLMREQVLQLPVFDLGLVLQDFENQPTNPQDPYPNYNFVSALATVIGSGNRSAPNANGYFQPIRTGNMTIERLTLLDSFGRVYSLTPQEVQPSNSLTFSADVSPGTSTPPQLYLPPRLAQPAQTIFRWLSAEDDQSEMNIYPAATPICGWLLPNNLDASLIVYDADGNPLGSINQSADWEATPGAEVRLDAGQIPNMHLRNLVNKLIINSSTTDDEAEILAQFLANLLSALNSSMVRIEPENFAQQESIALLIGRPVAVVRASLGVQFMGLSQINQSYAAYLSTLYETRECAQLDIEPFNNPLTNHYEQVLMSLRVGERQQFNDGLVGYWREDEEGTLGEVFYAPKAASAFLNPQFIWSGDRTVPSIAVVDDPNQPTNVLPVNPMESPHNLTMLIDPRGLIHATAGMLPVKAIGIPSQQYTAALKNMSVTFLISPLVTNSQQPHLPLSTQPGSQWSWVTHPDASTWVTAGATSDNSQMGIAGTSQTGVFTPQHLVEGWLKLSQTPEETSS